MIDKTKLISTSTSDHDSERVNLERQLEKIFPHGEWEIHPDISCYSEDNKKNIWNNEMRRGVQRKIESSSLTSEDYESWLGDVHFTNISISSKRLFDAYRRNAGWRIVLMSIPRVSSVVVGIASHYQNAQNNRKLAKVSNWLYEIAKEAYEKQGSRMFGRKVSSEDWDQTGLIPSPVRYVAGINITPEEIFLKDVRTTTLKKTLSSFITLELLPDNADSKDIESELIKVRDLAQFLQENVYPYQTVEEFESFRSLALQDEAAASTRLMLKDGGGSANAKVKIFYGPPGTGKTLRAVKEALEIVGLNSNGSFEEAFLEFNRMDQQCAFITFHPSLQYEDLIESIRPCLDDAGTVEDDEIDNGPVDNEGLSKTITDSLRYKIHEGAILRHIRRALRHPEKEFVIVIDEINRGDVSRILGPLISSLESDKRAGAKFPIGIELLYPLSEELETRLFMPSNLHFLGTMNSSDRNIALVDHALRRRFEFIELPPQPDLLETTKDAESIDCKRLLESINARIEYLLDADHCIGHGYFVNAKSNKEVVQIMATKVIPLLREYFYGNEGLVLLVLGDSSSKNYNFFNTTLEEDAYNKLFNVDVSEATKMGYRASSMSRSLRINPLFWNASKITPSPDDENYAVRCIAKVYEDLSEH